MKEMTLMQLLMAADCAVRIFEGNTRVVLNKMTKTDDYVVTSINAPVHGLIQVEVKQRG